MPDFSALPAADLVTATRAVYTGVRDTPDILAALTDYGYTLADVEHGLDLTEDAETEMGEQRAEYAEQYAATAAARAAVASLEALLVRHRTLAGIAHPRGSDGYRALGLPGRLPGSMSGLVGWGSTFYHAIEADLSLTASVRGLGKDAVADGLARVDAARVAMDTQSRETGEAQQATAEMLTALARLRAHGSEMARVATVALKDQPQKRESLGLMERGS